ncbi:serine/threonine protein kinase [Methylobacterium sp.]|uniref:serine/threonine protein kinase n=1 Tax=Methylobacterium sp. TaxID=409 RepID=UPI00262D731B|nr:serine/threonine protein kinase [Methylobacterium sp.]
MHRDTLLTPAIGFALLALSVLATGASLTPPALAQAAPPTQTRAQGQPQAASQALPPSQALPQPQSQTPQQAAPAAQPQGQPARPAAPGQASGTAGGRGSAQVGRNRRPSFAACNRISHARGLRGGARRRFLVRCKLGYDRPRPAQPQPAPARQP